MTERDEREQLAREIGESVGLHHSRVWIGILADHLLALGYTRATPAPIEDAKVADVLKWLDQLIDVNDGSQDLHSVCLALVTIRALVAERRGAVGLYKLQRECHRVMAVRAEAAEAERDRLRELVKDMRDCPTIGSARTLCDECRQRANAALAEKEPTTQESGQ